MTQTQKLTTALQKLSALHESLDRYFLNYRKLSGQNLACKEGCSACCYVSLSVFSLEAANILAWVGRMTSPQKLALLKTLNQPVAKLGPNALGIEQSPCVFLRNGACAIYPVRPTICRSQGAILWMQETYDVCPLNFTEPNSLLPSKDWLHLERLNDALASIQNESTGGQDSDRVMLSELIREVIEALESESN